MAQKASQQSPRGKRTRVVLNVEDIRINADPLKIGEMVHKLIADSEFRESFHEDPIAELRTVGIRVPERLRSQITRENVNATLETMIEGSYAVESPAALPAVAVGVSVGTDPGTAPVVIVGVTVVTGTSTFCLTQKTVPFERKAELWSGLAARQANQRAKRADLEKLNKRLAKDAKSQARDKK